MAANEAADDDMTDERVHGPSKSLGQLIDDLGQWVPITMFGALAAGMVGPMLQWILLNYFARAHTSDNREVSCEVDVQSSPCQSALMDMNKVLMCLALVSPFVQLITLPAVGVFSDAYGRKISLVLVVGVFGANLLCQDAIVFLNASVWPFICISVVIGPQLMNVILNASIADVLDGPSRAAGIGVIMGIEMLAGMTGMLIGLAIGKYWSFAIATAIYCCQLGFLIFFFKETLPAEMRKKADLQDFMFWRSLAILYRGPWLRRLSMVALLSSFIDAGTAHAVPLFLQRTMNWLAKDGYIWSLCSTSSAIIWACFGFILLLKHLGEVGVLAFARITLLIYLSIVCAASKPWMVEAAIFCLGGPGALTLPVLSSLKSNLVGDNEQGRIQAGLNTIMSFSGAGGTLAFGLMYDDLGRGKHAAERLEYGILIPNIAFAVFIWSGLYDLYGSLPAARTLHGKDVEKGQPLSSSKEYENSSETQTVARNHAASYSSFS
eukprot:TRINITY_DN16446_c0_g1_i1.p1 TRINITY_DN16446_c0_g1~~TRINITY_DN16446_c0_g1_i1.p1  ORF type:complete len:492 (+),score=65.00 TRINITY_DN16446_c0_g1_i1:81-1556(+)